MSWPRLIVRSMALLGHAVWLGGLTFYGVVVIPILHDEFGSLEGGLITQKVSDLLNLIGLATLVVWWGLVLAERREGMAVARRIRAALLASSSLLLGFLAVDHAILDARLARFGLADFYGYHRVYLIATTVQWGINVAIVPSTLLIWARPSSSEATRRG